MSDLHIFAHSLSLSKLQSCLDCLDWVYSEAVKRKIKYVIFAGDLFHDRNKINIYAYDSTYSILSKYAKDVKSYFILGNHDMYYRTSRQISSVKPFSEIVEVVSEPKKISIEGRTFDLLPYTENPVKEINDNFSKKSDILVGHLALQGAVLNALRGTRYESDSLEERITETPLECLSGYQRAFLGHFHARQKINATVEYLGSPLQLSFGEAMCEKGFTILNLKTLETEFVENNFTPKYFILPADADFSQYDLKGSYVRLVSSGISEMSVVDVKNEMNAKYDLRNIEIINENDTKSNLQVSESFKDDFSTSIYSQIASYVDSLEDVTLEKEMLAEIGMRIVQHRGTE